MAFENPRAKLGRARKHIADAVSEIEFFRKQARHYLVVEDDPDPDFQRLVVHPGSLVPTEIPLNIGDAIHNLRSALDHLACDVASRANSATIKNVRFPIAINRAALKEQTQNLSNYIDCKALALIWNLKPYAGGNDYITSLHFMDIVDKHRLIVPVAHVLTGFGTTFIRNRSTITFLPSYADMQTPLTAGGTIHRMKRISALSAGDMEVTSLEIAFSDLSESRFRFAGEPLLPTLTNLADYIEHVIDYFEKRYVCREKCKRPLPPRLAKQAILTIE